MASGSSNASSFSASSGHSTLSKPLLRSAAGENDRDDLLNAKQNLLNGVHGLLFSIYKERNSGRLVWRWALLSLVIDYWQLFSTLVNPSMGWAIDPLSKGWLYATMPNWQFMRILSYNFYMAMLYTGVVTLAIYMVLGAYVTYTFHKQEFDKVLPSKVLFFLSWLLFQCFDLAAVNLLEVGFNCQYSNVPHALRGYLTFFPDRDCMKMPHFIHVIVSVVFLFFFLTLCIFYKISQVEVDPFSRSLSGVGHSGPVITYFLVKVMITTVPIFVNYKKVVAIIYLGLTWYNFYIFVRYNPHLVSFMNYIRAGTNFSMFYISFLLVMLVFRGDFEWKDTLTWIMIGGFIPAGAFGALIAFLRHTKFTDEVRMAFSEADPEMPLKDIFDFVSPLDVEVAARIGRVWQTKKLLDKEALSMSELVIKAGLASFPSNSYVTILYANFIIEGHEMLQPGQRQMQAATKQDPSPMVKYMLFVREQLATLKAVGQAKGGQLDLVSYADYQRKHRSVMQAHKDALTASSQFWQLLQGRNVSFNSLSKALGHIETTVRRAERSYRLVLEQYSSNAKLLRLYARFLETIKNDPITAEQYYSEASKAEELQGDTGDQAGGHATLLREGAAAMAQDSQLNGNLALDERNSVTILANASGIIQMTSTKVTTILGYRKGELEGKNVSCLMPQPWSGLHTGYIKKFTVTSEDKSHVRQQAFVALHKDGFCFPTWLTFGKASGLGEDSILMGVVEPIRVKPGFAMLWTLPNGIVVGADANFSALSGCYHGEFVGSRLGSVLFDSLERINQVAIAGEDSIESNSFLSDLFDHFLNTETHVQAPRPTSKTNDIRAPAVPRNETRLNRNNTQSPGIPPHRPHPAPSGPSLSAAPVDPTSQPGTKNRAPRSVCLLHKYADPVVCLITVKEVGVPNAIVYQVEFEMPASSINQMLMVCDQKGAIRYMNQSMAGILGIQQYLPSLIAQAGFNRISNIQQNQNVHKVFDGAQSSGVNIQGRIIEFKLSEFLPAPWNAFHARWLKEAVFSENVNTSSCRSPAPGPVLTMSDVKSRPFQLHISVTSKEEGEVLHLVKAYRATMEEGLALRRLQLRLSESGEVLSISEKTPSALFGFDPSALIGQPIWSCVDFGVEDNSLEKEMRTYQQVQFQLMQQQQGEQQGEQGRLSPAPIPERQGVNGKSYSQRLFIAMVRRSLYYPGSSWHVAVLRPGARAEVAASLEDFVLASSLIAKRTRAAVLQLDVVPPSDFDTKLTIMANLWATTSLSAALELDTRSGNVIKVLEPDLRPAGLLFNVPSSRLTGLSLTQLFDYKLHPSLAPLNDKSLTGKALLDLLFEGVLTMKTKGALKNVGQTQARQNATNFLTGPTTFLPITLSDGITLRASVQITVKTGSNTMVAYVKPVDVQPPKPEAIRGALLRQLSIRRRVVDLQAPRRDGEESNGDGQRQGRRSSAILPSFCQLDLDIPGTGGMPAKPSTDVMPRPPTPNRDTDTAGMELHSSNNTGRAQTRFNIRGDSGAVSKMEAVENYKTPAELLDSVDAKVLDSNAAAPAVTLGDNADNNSEEGDRLSEDGGAAEQAQAGKASMVTAWVQSKGAYFPSSPPPANAQQPVSPRPGGATASAGPDSLVRKVNVEVMGMKSQSQSQVFVEGDAVLGMAPQDLDWKSCLPVAEDVDDDEEGDIVKVKDTLTMGANGEGDNVSEGGSVASGTKSNSSTGSDYNSTKRFRKLIRMMNSTSSQMVMRRLKQNINYVVYFIAIVHIAFFAIMVTTLHTQEHDVVRLTNSMHLFEGTAYTALASRVIDLMHQGYSRQYLYTMSEFDAWMDVLDTNTMMLKTNIDDINIRSLHGKDDLFFNLNFGHKLTWIGKYLNGSDMFVNMSLYDEGSLIVASGREIMQQNRIWVAGGHTVGSRDEFNFVMNNVFNFTTSYRYAMDSLLFQAAGSTDNVNVLHMVFLVVEGCVLATLAMLYISLLLQTVAVQRYNLYDVFLNIPISLTRSIATRTLHMLDDDESSDDESIDGDVMDIDTQGNLSQTQKAQTQKAAVDNRRDVEKTQAKTAKAMADQAQTDLKAAAAKKNAAMMDDKFKSVGNYVSWAKYKTRRWIVERMVHFGLRQNSNMNVRHHSDRLLKRDSLTTIIMIWPFLLWSVVIIIIYGVGYTMLLSSRQPLANQSVTNYALARIVTAATFAQELCYRGVDGVPTYLPLLRLMYTRVRFLYYTLLLGDRAYLVTGGLTDSFPMVTVSSTSDAPEVAELIFSSNTCLRLNRSSCPDVTSKFYEVTHLGLNTMMTRFLREMEELMYEASEVPSYLNMSNPHLDYIFSVVLKDMIDGFQKLSDVHLETLRAPFLVVTNLHIVALVLCLVGSVSYIYFLVHPLLSKVKKETFRIAELLSQLPKELDILRVVSQVLEYKDSKSAIQGLPKRSASRDSRMQRGDESQGGASSVASSEYSTAPKGRLKDI